MHRFLGRLWRLGADVAERGQPGPIDASANGAAGDDVELLRKAHWAIDKVTRDLERAGSPRNTAIAAVIELVNEITKHRDALVATAPRAVSHAALRRRPPPPRSIFPFAPHSRLGRLRAAHRTAGVGGAVAGGRPGAAGARDEVEIATPDQRQAARPHARAGATPTERSSRRWRRERPRVQAHIDGKDVVKVIVVPSKLVNFVVR